MSNYKITAKLPSGIPECLSDFTESGDEEDIIGIVYDADGDAEEAAALLSANKNVYGKFEVFRQRTDGFVLKTTDCWGNKHYLNITKQ